MKKLYAVLYPKAVKDYQGKKSKPSSLTLKIAGIELVLLFIDNLSGLMNNPHLDVIGNIKKNFFYQSYRPFIIKVVRQTKPDFNLNDEGFTPQDNADILDSMMTWFL